MHISELVYVNPSLNQIHKIKPYTNMKQNIYTQTSNFKELVISILPCLKSIQGLDMLVLLTILVYCYQTKENILKRCGQKQYTKIPVPYGNKLHPTNHHPAVQQEPHKKAYLFTKTCRIVSGKYNQEKGYGIKRKMTRQIEHEVSAEKRDRRQKSGIK